MNTLDVSKLKFDEKELIPAIIQDHEDNQVLMMAYMNRESLQKTLETSETWFWSRSRKELWHKGATSGNIQKVKTLSYDCDADALLIKVEQVGGKACHTGARSCFFNHVVGSKVHPGSAQILKELYAVIQDRKLNPKEDSYVSKQLAKGQERYLKKITEEAGEIVIAAMQKDREEIIHEVADLWFHTLLVLGDQGIPPEEIFAELDSRKK